MREVAVTPADRRDRTEGQRDGETDVIMDDHERKSSSELAS